MEGIDDLYEGCPRLRLGYGIQMSQYNKDNAYSFCDIQKLYPVFHTMLVNRSRLSEQFQVVHFCL